MSSRGRKRKLPVEPVLQDYTVTSFSDLHADGPGPSDSSIFEEIKNCDVEMAETTFNKTIDINMLSGQYPSDSSLDFLSKSKTRSVSQRPFQKKSRKKSVKDNFFDSCLKDSISDCSLEKDHKPLRRKKKKNVLHNVFDSDLESNTPTNSSPFKKPFQRISKNQQKENLFDSLVKDSQPNTPDKVLRPFQRQSKKKINSLNFDEVLSSGSFNQPSPVQNFISRRKARKTKVDESNIFDKVLDTSQSDVSMSLHPLASKHRPTSNHKQNNSEMFDDILASTSNVLQNETSSILETCNKSSNPFDNHSKSFNLEYNEETGNYTENNGSENEETECVITDQIKENENQSRSELTEKLNRSDNKTITDKDNFDENKSTTVSSDKINLLAEKAITDGDSFDENKSTSCDQRNLSDEKEITGEENLDENKSANVSSDQGNLTEEKTLTDEENFDGDKSTTLSSDQRNLTKDKTLTDEEDFDGDKSTTLSSDQENLTEDKTLTEEENVGEDKSRTVSSDQENLTEEENVCEDKSTTVSYDQGHVSDDKDTDEFQEKVVDARSSIVIEDMVVSALRNSTSSIKGKRVSFFLNKDIMEVNEDSDPSISLGNIPSSTPNSKGKRVSFLLDKDMANSVIEDDKINENQILSTSRNSAHNLELNLRNAKHVSRTMPIETRVEVSVENNITSTTTKSILCTSKGNTDSRIVNYITDDCSILSKKIKVRNNISTCSDARNSYKSQHSKKTQSNIHSSSIALESLVYEEPSEGETPVSESVYIDIHPSRSKSATGIDTEILSNSSINSSSEVSKTKYNKQKFHEDTTRSVNEKSLVREESSLSFKESAENNYLDSNGEEQNTIENTNFCENLSADANEINTLSNEENQRNNDSESENEEKEIELMQEVESEEKESNVNGQNSTDEEEDQPSEEEEEEQESEDSGESEKEEQESEEGEDEQESLKEDGEGETGKNKTVLEESLMDNHDTTEEYVNPGFLEADEVDFQFKAPKHKIKFRSSSLFREKLNEVPTKSQLQDMLKKIPFSELKKKKKRKSSEHYMSREQMQQYDIEEELMRNQIQKKTQNTKFFSGSSKLKRPKKWVSPKFYEFLISKLKPQYGIRSRVKAEELVLFLVDRVECIKKKKELIRDDVEEMKIKLATLNVVKTHWDFYKFVNLYFDCSFKEKMYPSLPGVGHSAFDFGPTDVMENIV